MRRIDRRLTAAAALLLVLLSVMVLSGWPGSRFGRVRDEAMLAGRTPGSFPAADEDYFAAMDNGAALTADQVKGRNLWLVWSGGNDRFWDRIARNSFGTFDLLKTISSSPGPRSGISYSRDNRWTYFGLVNEPCFTKATAPDPTHYGLWLDQRDPSCKPDPFANAEKYPGVRIGARGTTLPAGSYYGEPTGIVGLRLFPNPDFDEAARQKWDAGRYYNDTNYYLSKDLVRPYRVGMSCGFCHVGPSPIHPPADPERPAWADLNSTVGAQYFWFDRVFVWNADESNFIFQLLHAYRPGALDTSLVSTDNIVNPRTMNAIYNLPARMAQARAFGKETLAGGELDNQQLPDFYREPDTWTPRVLKDGADSVGVLGALNRVFINIGLFSEEWLLHFNPFVGGQRNTPIRIADAERNSVYWRATEAQTPFLAQFLLAAGKPDRLADAPGGALYLTADAATLDRGRTVFAERCARCHSSSLPEPMPVRGLGGGDGESCAGPDYLACWNAYWAWTKTDEFKRKMLAIVRAPNFPGDNYLSTEFRVPVTLLQTNACSPLATNAIAGDVWDNFSSHSYKALPAVGTIGVQDPMTGANRTYAMPGGGRGYTRPPSLISLWSTAPYLLNNTLGRFNSDPSVGARVDGFERGMEEMLWPEKRAHDAVLGDRGVGLIDRTNATSWLKVPRGYLPGIVVALRKPLGWLLPNVFSDLGDVRIGPIPKGTPVDLLGNLDPLSERTDAWSEVTHAWRLLTLGLSLRRDLAAMPPGTTTDDQAARILSPLSGPLMALSKCPDFVVNRGHYFGTSLFPEEPGLSDPDKRALIAFLKTL